MNALSVDLEDWYHVCGPGKTADPAQWDSYESRVARSTERLLSHLRARGTRATFFVLGYIAEREPALIRAVARPVERDGLARAGVIAGFVVNANKGA